MSTFSELEMLALAADRCVALGSPKPDDSEGWYALGWDHLNGFCEHAG